MIEFLAATALAFAPIMICGVIAWICPILLDIFDPGSGFYNG